MLFRFSRLPSAHDLNLIQRRSNRFSTSHDLIIPMPPSIDQAPRRPDDPIRQFPPFPRASSSSRQLPVTQPASDPSSSTSPALFAPGYDAFQGPSSFAGPSILAASRTTSGKSNGHGHGRPGLKSAGSSSRHKDTIGEGTNSPTRINRTGSTPGLQRTKSKGKEKERERPPFLKEIGSAKISLRPAAVQDLSDEDGDEERDTVSKMGQKGDFEGYSINRGNPGISRQSSDITSPTPTSPTPHATPLFRAPPLSSTSTIAPRAGRRTRSNSVHIPRTPDIGNSYFLPHFSTDRTYSKDRDTAISLEFGLGGDFDASFGEALRRGEGGEEMQLPQEALRVLTEVKMAGKQGRKGSIGMGLFRESRAVLQQQQRMEVVQEGKQSKDSEKSVSAATSSVVKETGGQGSPVKGMDTGIPTIPTPRKRYAEDETTSPQMRRSSTRRQIPPRPTSPSPAKHISAPKVFGPDLSHSEDSGWTTASSSASFTGSESDSVSGTEDEELGRVESYDSESLEGKGAGESETEVSGEEEDRMTVPLQPFNHAVGGHSSIYNFTRRAVCKVS